MIRRDWRFINTAPLGSSDNMALDEALLSRFLILQNPSPVFRVYQWARSSFSLGVSQLDIDKYLDINSCARDSVAIVRRMTGGGILFHDSEITYSIVLPDNYFGDKLRVVESFKSLCAILISFYKKLGLDAGFDISEDSPGLTRQFMPFCALGREKYDIIINGAKIGGNAQKRVKGVIFQHGSIPLSIDRIKMLKYAPGYMTGESDRVTALDQLLGHHYSIDRLIRILRESLEETFRVNAVIATPDKDELVLAAELKRDKYTQYDWNFKRIGRDVFREEAGLVK